MKSTGRMAVGMEKSWLLTGLGATLHFLVDALCVSCLFLLAAEGCMTAFIGVFMVYNVLAFLTQPFTGMLADSPKLRPLLLPAAVVLLAAGTAFTSLLIAIGRSETSATLPLLLVALPLGIGNSLFHVWGGKTVILATTNDIRALGLFVSTGAFGLAVGVLLHAWWLLYLLLILTALTAAAASRIAVADTPLPGPEPREIAMETSGGNSRRAEFNLYGKAWFLWSAVLFLMAFVLFRSFMGEALTANVSKGGAMVLVIGGVAMLGKAAGGWAAHGLRPSTVFLVAIAGAVACLLLGKSLSGLWLPGLLFINATMAITLYWANRALLGREGLAFGLLAASLMPGYLLAMFGAEAATVIPSLLLTLVPTIVVEAGVLWLLRERRSDVLWSSVVVNILTNVPLHLILLSVGNTWTTLLVGELTVIVVEMLWYLYFIGNIRNAAIYSILCNAISFLVGLLVQLFVLLFQSI